MMGPIRKSRSMNKRYSDISKVSPSKDSDSSKRSNTRKRKLTDMLGPQWSKEELTRFYEAYRKHGKEWRKVAGAVRNRSPDMVEALYTMNRAYLSLPEGTASVVGLIAMMTDHYSNLAGSDSEQESNDGAGSSRKSQKRAPGKGQPATSKGSDGQLLSQSQTVPSNYGCLSLLKKKRSGGSQPRPVGKRTPRFPVSFLYENSNGDKYYSPTRQGLKIKANANDDEVAHEIAIALAEASRGGSPQVSRTPSRRAESVMSSPFRHAQRKPSVTDIVDAKLSPTDMDEEEDLEGSTEADTGELSRNKSHFMEFRSVRSRQKGKKHAGKKLEDDNNSDNHLDDIKEECSGTDTGHRLGTTKEKFEFEVTNAEDSRSPIQNQRKKSKKVFSGIDESPTFDALQTLADLSLMMPAENEDESRVQFKDEDADHVDEIGTSAVSAKQQRDSRRSTGVRMKGYHPMSSLEVASNKTSKHGKVSALDSGLLPEENQALKRARKKQKVQASKIQKTEVQPDIQISQSLGNEDGDEEKLASKSKKSSLSGSPKLLKISENSNSDLRKDGSDSAQSAAETPVVNQVNLPTKVRSRRKMDLKKPEKLKFPEKLSNDQTSLPFPASHDRGSVKEKLSNCLSNHLVRRWCTYEWFYSAIDYPWFAKREFVEYLYHVGLGHVPRLTHVEWGVIRSSLGKPRRFSEQFLKEENEKLNQYRDSVRKHYAELREGIREGLPTDLARPLSVGQRVIAIHPKTREIHDGSVLTVDHARCLVQFDRQELGVEFVKDINCMPLNPSQNMPALLGKQIVSVDKFYENFSELKMNGQGNEYMKNTSGDNLDTINGLSHLSPLAHPPSTLLKQEKVASADANIQNRTVAPETVTYQQTASPHPSSLASLHAKEADVQALMELTRALEKKETIIQELRRMNDDVVENQKDGTGSLKESDLYKKQYAAVLVQLNEANKQVSSALSCLRQRNTYQVVPRPITNFGEPGSLLSCLDHSECQPHESLLHVNEIIGSSRVKARTMVDAAKQAVSSLKDRVEKIEEAIDYVNAHLPMDDVASAADPNFSSTTYKSEAQIPSELITNCVATLIMIQKCTERQFPPGDVAQVLDSAVMSLQPCSAQNLPVYAEIQKCMGIIRSQILALVPT